jgi:hypothetical protein
MAKTMREDRISMDRREFLKAGLVATAALPVAGALLRAGTARAEGEFVTDIEGMKATAAALQYVHVSTKPDQNCKTCQFYTPEAAGGKGKCQLFPQGFVKETGWCASWTKKVA